MKCIHATKILCMIGLGISCVLMSWVFCQTPAAEEQPGDIMIIGHPNLSEHALSQVDVQNIFLGKKKKLGDINVTFVIIKSGEVHERFLEEFLSRTSSQYNKYWKKMVFTGKGKAPKVFETEDALVEYVKENEGVIGYIGIEAFQRIGHDGLHQFILQ